MCSQNLTMSTQCTQRTTPQNRNFGLLIIPITEYKIQPHFFQLSQCAKCYFLNIENLQNWLFKRCRCEYVPVVQYIIMLKANIFSILIMHYTTLLEKYLTLLFAKIWWISMTRVFMRWPWTFIHICEFFHRLLIASVDGQ